MFSFRIPFEMLMLLLYKKPLYSNFLLPFLKTVKFCCEIMNSDKK